jgi:hypothetical protein
MFLALGWVLNHLSDFSVSERLNIKSSVSKVEVTQLKPISELALTIWLVLRCGFRHQILKKLVRWIWEQTDSAKLLTKLLLARNDFLPCCSLYASLYSLGYRSESCDRLLSFLSKSDMAAALPLSPWADLALSYNLWLLRLAPMPKLKRGRFYIGKCPEPWIVSGELAYAITHEVFYLSDFSFGSLDEPDVSEYLRIWVPYWASIFHEEGDYDLTSELAMVWSCLGSAHVSGRPEPLSLVLPHQEADGHMPGPKGAGEYLFVKDDSSERRMFLSNYHTTLVTIMACALSATRFSR